MDTGQERLADRQISTTKQTEGRFAISRNSAVSSVISQFAIVNDCSNGDGAKSYHNERISFLRLFVDRSVSILH